MVLFYFGYPPPPPQGIFNQLTDIYETWYDCHAILPMYILILFYQ
jgi:hypothetical protein